MNCGIHGCPGHCEHRLIIHTVKRGADLLMFENVPAEVCDICSDTLLAPATIRRLEELMRNHGSPEKHAPVYAFR